MGAGGVGDERGPMNLGPHDQLLHVRRDTLQSFLVAFGSMEDLTDDQRALRQANERDRIRRILRQGGE